MPERQFFDVSGSGSLLLMPAWIDDQMLGVKVVQVFPGNTRLGIPAVSSMYILSSAVTGEVRAVIDGAELTVRRTAAASALASRHLSRESSRCLLVMGAGALALPVISAHASVRPIDLVLLWARRPEAAEALAIRVNAETGLRTEVVRSLPAALERADIVSTITTAREPILPGALVRAGTHVDLIGAFTPHMREADDDVMRLGIVFVDMRAAALSEAGDILDPISRRIIAESAIRGDLSDLCRGLISGRSSEKQITVFKSVGLALEDLAAATLALRSLENSVSDAAPAFGSGSSSP
jgi:ornithine cyclodeaminase